MGVTDAIDGAVGGCVGLGSVAEVEDVGESVVVFQKRSVGVGGLVQGTAAQ